MGRAERPAHAARRRHAPDGRARAGGAAAAAGGAAPHTSEHDAGVTALGVGLRHTPKGSDLCQLKFARFWPFLTVLTSFSTFILIFVETISFFCLFSLIFSRFRCMIFLA